MITDQHALGFSCTDLQHPIRAQCVTQCRATMSGSILPAACSSFREDILPLYFSGDNRPHISGSHLGRQKNDQRWYHWPFLSCHTKASPVSDEWLWLDQPVSGEDGNQHEWERCPDPSVRENKDEPAHLSGFQAINLWSKKKTRTNIQAQETHTPTKQKEQDVQVNCQWPHEMQSQHSDGTKHHSVHLQPVNPNAIRW